MSRDETPAEELSRLVIEYNEGERQNRAEAWNLIADFTCEHVDSIIAALKGWRDVEVDTPPHGVPVLLWSPPTLGFPDGLIELAPFSSGHRSSSGWSTRSQHAYAKLWHPLPAAPKVEPAQ